MNKTHIMILIGISALLAGLFSFVSWTQNEGAISLSPPEGESSPSTLLRGEALQFSSLTSSLLIGFFIVGLVAILIVITVSHVKY